MDAKPVTLVGEKVRLVPMTAADLPALIEAGAFEELWRWTTSRADTPDSMRDYVMAALADASAATALPFVTVDIESGRVIGSTRFGNIDHPNRRVEIGWTWITPAFQRSHVNSEAKYLMLRHAFEEWACVRVELKTDFLNEMSRNAMLRIGCREEGTLRKHMLTYSGRWRDTVYYSVLDSEWPAVRARLLEFIARRGA